VCSLPDCETDIDRGELAFYIRESGRLLCLRCVALLTLRRATSKSADDRRHAIRIVCRLYDVKAHEALPDQIRAAALALGV
jgi:hypothetical protein